MAATDFTHQTRALPGSAAIPSDTGRLHPLVWVYLLAVIIPMGMQVGPIAMTSLRLLLMVMVIPMLVRLFSGQYGRIFATDVLFILYLLWTAVALAVNNPNLVIEQTGSVGMEFLGGYAMGRAYIRTRHDFLALGRALILVVILMTPLAVFETLTGRSLIIELMRALPGIKTVGKNGADPRSLFGVTLQRVQVGFQHPIHFGLFCSVTFSLCFVAMKGQMSTVKRWVLGGLLAFTACLALSSGAILAVAMQCAFIAWAGLFARVPARWWILVGLAVLAYVVIDLLSNRTPIQVFMSYATFSAQTAYYRALIFEWGIKNVWMNPVFGLGFKDWIRPAFMHSSSVDNFWLLTAMRYGIPAFLILTIGYVLIIAHVMRRDFRDDPVLTQIRLAWVFTFLGLSFTLCTVHVWTAIYSFTFFLLGAGVWLITVLPEDVESADIDTDLDARKGPVFARDLRAAPVVARAKQDAVPTRGDAPRYSRFSGPDES